MKLIWSVLSSVILFANLSMAATPINPNKKASSASSSADSSGFYPMFSLGLGFQTFSATATIGYEFNRFLANELTAAYRQKTYEDRYEKAYGLEDNGIFRLANPTIATPFVGIGLGYEKWQRMVDGQEFDSAASPYWDYFVGAEAKLTSFISIVGKAKWINYMRPPKEYSDMDSFESRNQYQFTVGFIIRLNFGD